MESETLKAQLRTRIRSDRAARVAREAESRTPSAAAGPTWPHPSIAATAWTAVERLWPDLDLSGVSMLSYAALSGEPELDSVIDRFLSHGGTVYLPVVTTVGRALMFGAVTDSMATIKPQGKWGIREPAPELSATQLLSAEVALDLAFVPALGFGAGGARLGNGGGFYDRSFGPQGEAPLGTGNCHVYGVCFVEEIDLPGLTAEPWDLTIPHVVTEEGIHSFG